MSRLRSEPVERRRWTVRDLRRDNRSVLLWSLFFDQPCSRQDLSGATGLSPASISNVTRELIEEGIVAEAGSVDSDGGRPRTLLQIDRRIETERIGPVAEEQRRLAGVDYVHRAVGRLQGRRLVGTRDDDCFRRRLRLYGWISSLLCKACGCTKGESKQRSSCVHADELS